MKHSLFFLALLVPALLFTGCNSSNTNSNMTESSSGQVMSQLQYGVVNTPAPVFNKLIFGELVLDDWGTYDPMAFTAYQGTAVTIQEEVKQNNFDIYRITTKEYPSAEETLYIDARFVDIHDTPQPERTITLPTQDEIIASLTSQVGKPYIWGGNYSAGLPVLKEYLAKDFDQTTSPQNVLLGEGGDCSGILWEATDGYTPRNTSQLITFGEAVDIENKSASEIIPLLQPLDIIVWKGHNIIVLPNGQAIESRWAYDGSEPEDFTSIWVRDHGVKIHSLEDVFAFVMNEKGKIPVNNYENNTAGLDQEGKAKPVFVVKRWYKEV